VLNDGQSSAEALQTTAALARRADELGYARFWVAEHHNMPSVACTAPTVLMAHLAAVTERVNQGLIVPDVLDQIYETFRPVIPYDRIGFALVSGDGSEARAQWARSEASPIRLGAGYVGDITNLCHLSGWFDSLAERCVANPNMPLFGSNYQDVFAFLVLILVALIAGPFIPAISSLSLPLVGVLFLIGGWQLERLRRRLNARIAGDNR